MLLITRKAGEEFTAVCDKKIIKFKIKRIRGDRGNEKVEIMAIAPKDVEFKWDKQSD